MKFPRFNLTLKLNRSQTEFLMLAGQRLATPALVIGLWCVSLAMFWFYYRNGLGLAYNDARSHLDIGRRVVEGLKPGLAQLGSVWLPLPHLLMVPTIWNDFFWHSGLSGALQSMISFVVTAVLIRNILRTLKVGWFGQLVGIFAFTTNLNILYLQSTAMTELLLIVTMTAGVYELIRYAKEGKTAELVKAAFWIMLATLVRYDGWFLCFYAALFSVFYAWRKKGYYMAEGTFFLFCTLAGFGVFLWLVWNAAIFKDPLYFAFGPYSAHAQQEQLAEAGVLLTKSHLWISIKTYWYAMVYNSGVLPTLLGLIGAAVLLFDRRHTLELRLAAAGLMAPLAFNVLALYLGHSVLFVQNLNGNTWFNVRYGVMMIPSFAVFIGYLVDRLPNYRYTLFGLLVFVTIFSALNGDAVTIDDGRVGSSQKNVSEVSSWLHNNAGWQEGFILISAASHDAIIFSSGLPMTRYIHEGTGKYWESATTSPDRWARWIVMRTNDPNDQTFRLTNFSGALYKYTLVQSYPFADIYELKPEYLNTLETKPVIQGQK